MHNGDVSQAVPIKGETSMNKKISVVITTYNRFIHLIRAIESVKRQSTPAYEIIVIDDHSVDETPQIKDLFPEVAYYRQCRNMGPGVARNEGILRANGDLVVFLDDDDELLPEALEKISHYAGLFLEFPVIQLARSNGSVLSQGIIFLDNYLKGEVSGDFAPVINRELFLKYGLAYPTTRIGGEHLLWWTIAAEWGIPTLSTIVMRLNDDAQERLTSPHTQVSKANEHFLLTQETLNLFGDSMRQIAPSLYLKKLLGAVIYGKLSGTDLSLWPYVRKIFFTGSVRDLLIAILIIALPKPFVRRVFLRIRS